MALSMMLWGRIINQRIKQIVELDDIQFGFRKGMSTSEPIFALRMLDQNYTDIKEHVSYCIC